MKKTITIYELLGKVKDDKDTNIYVKYINRMTEKEDTMWSCVENIIDKLDNKVIYLNDEVEIISDEEEFIDIEEITLNGEKLGYGVLSEWLGSKQTDNEAKLCSSIECLGITLNLLIKNQKKIIERLNKEN